MKKEKEYILVEKKSKFISYVYRVFNEEDVKDILTTLRKKFFDARHIVYGYVLEKGNIKYSDDGEPSGTAGAPIANILEKENFMYTLVVVIRYFGGTLLGTGGLIKAYTDSTKGVLKDFENIKYIKGIELSFFCKYDEQREVKNFLMKNNIEILDTEYMENCRFKISVKEEDFEKVKKELNILLKRNIDIINKKSVLIKEKEKKEYDGTI